MDANTRFVKCFVITTFYNDSEMNVGCRHNDIEISGSTYSEHGLRQLQFRSQIIRSKLYSDSYKTGSLATFEITDGGRLR